jgi:hypothetical protein
MIYQAQVAELTLGGTINLVAGLHSSEGENTRTVNDLWIDPATKDVHILVETNSAVFGDDYTRSVQPREALYYYKPAGADWADHNLEVADFYSTFRARFMESATSLYVLRGDTSGGGVRVREVSKADITGAIGWKAITEYRVADIPFGFVLADGIWVEARSLQTEPVHGRGFVFTGHWPLQDNYLWHVELL